MTVLLIFQNSFIAVLIFQMDYRWFDLLDSDIQLIEFSVSSFFHIDLVVLVGNGESFWIATAISLVEFNF